jgi:hypothetical protein
MAQTIIDVIEIGNHRRAAIETDNHAMVWCPDGHLVGVGGDGNGFGPGGVRDSILFYRVTGGSPTSNLWDGADLWGGAGAATTFNGKSWGMGQFGGTAGSYEVLCLVGVSPLESGPSFDTRIARSAGPALTTWGLVGGWNAADFGNDFSYGQIIQHGQADALRPAVLGNFRYSMHRGGNLSGPGDDVAADGLHLLRWSDSDLRNGLIANASVCTGRNDDGTANWSTNKALKFLVHSNPGKLHRGFSVNYISYLDAYLFMGTSAQHPGGDDDPTDLEFWKAKYLWGPYEHIKTLTDWRAPDSTPQTRYCNSFQGNQKWIATTPDALNRIRIQIAYSGKIINDSFNTYQFALQLSDETEPPPPAPPPRPTRDFAPTTQLFMTSPSFATLSAFSVEFWIDPTANGRVFTICDPSGAPIDLSIRVIDGTMALVRSAGGVTQTSTSAAASLPFGEFRHVMAVFPAGANHRLFINGAPVTMTHVGAAVSAALNITATDELVIGDPTAPSLGGFTGRLSRLTLHPFAASEAYAKISYRQQGDTPAWVGISGENATADSNRSPVAVPVHGTVVAGEVVPLNPRAVAYDPNGDTLTLTGTPTVTPGGVSIVSGNLSYGAPPSAAGQTARGSFSLRDPGGKISTGDFRVAITDPVVVEPPTLTLTAMTRPMFNNEPSVDIPILGNATVTPAGSATPIIAASGGIVSQPAGGTLSVQNADQSNAFVRYARGTTGVGAQTGSVRASLFEYPTVTAVANVTVNIQSSTQPTFPSGLRWRSGCDFGQDEADYNNWGTWRGRDVDLSMAYIGNQMWTLAASGSWAKVRNNATSSIRPYVRTVYSQPNGRALSVGVPICIEADAVRHDMVANGDFLSHHQHIAGQIKQGLTEAGNSTRTIYIRVGWEHTRYGNYPWAIEIETGIRNNLKVGGGPGEAVGIYARPNNQYKRGFRRTADVYKQALQGQCKIVWNHLERSISFNLDDFYVGGTGPNSGGPDVSYDPLDVISVDPYNTGDLGTEQEWNSGNFYNAATGDCQGPRGHYLYAKAKGKKFSCSEWGATNKSLTAGDPANSAIYVQKMWELFNEAADAGVMEYEEYFHNAEANFPKHELIQSWGTNPRTPNIWVHNAAVAARYIQLWRP